ncbi:hypothetical protein C446_10425 [Halobiforma nitratireducens JCM 10879]|uniref:Uncharacterized protein n=1 Tax=Halobiforma nitratireducens JCM 10879 TaxID=1227454 RepID=M0LZM6_9EURY|nr:hypothetical protein C446_10425 [Halobiforma nitratireducens JCM 10879]
MFGGNLGTVNFNSGIRKTVDDRSIGVVAVAPLARETRDASTVGSYCCNYFPSIADRQNAIGGK